MKILKNVRWAEVVLFAVIIFAITMVSKVMVRWQFYGMLLSMGGAFISKDNKKVSIAYVVMGIIFLLL